MTQTELDTLDTLRERDYAIARAIGCSVIGPDTAMYSTNRYAAMDALAHYAWLRGYRSHILLGENGGVHVSLLKIGVHPQALLTTVASSNADRLETAIVAVILGDVDRRWQVERRRAMTATGDE